MEDIRKKSGVKDAWVNEGVPEYDVQVVARVRCSQGSGRMIVKYNKFGWWQQATTPCTWCALSYPILCWRYFE